MAFSKSLLWESWFHAIEDEEKIILELDVPPVGV